MLLSFPTRQLLEPLFNFPPFTIDELSMAQGYT
jgi:hypothetical protein